MVCAFLIKIKIGVNLVLGLQKYILEVLHTLAKYTTLV